MEFFNSLGRLSTLLVKNTNNGGNMNVFRLTLNDLLSAKINPSAPNLPSIETVNSTLEPMLYNTASPNPSKGGELKSLSPKNRSIKPDAIYIALKENKIFSYEKKYII